MILLDTQAYLWFLNGDEKLPDGIRDEIETGEGLFVSIASFWEIAIKNSLGKLDIPVSVTKMMEDCSGLNITILPIGGAHLEKLRSLPWIHRDPFDRLIISQALVEDFLIVTSDETIKQYDVKALWK